jgi:hypothetical protein
MPSNKLTSLTSLATPASADLLYLVDVSDTTDDPAGSSRKVTLAAVFGVGPFSYDFGSGGDNEAFGDNAGRAAASGGNNVCVGKGAGSALTSGADNVVVGSTAGDAVTTGSGNTLVGFSAGGAITTGGANTLVGNSAGGSITTGGNAVIVGASAGSALTTAQRCTLVGSGAGAGVSSGDSNTVIGYLSGQSVGSGTNNTLIGHQSGYAVTGSHNTWIGSIPGAGTLTSGTGNSLLGYDTDTQGTATTDGVALGRAAKCGSNTLDLSPYCYSLSGRRLSSTSTDRQLANIAWEWVDSTDATRKARATLNAYDTAARECVRLEASGTAPMLSFYGGSAVAQYATTGTATGYTGGGGTALTHTDTFTGNTGSTAYTIGDVVRALKLVGLIAA